MKGQINVGMAGCGLWGQDLARSFRALDGCAVDELDAGEARFETMLERADIDAVVVATPASTHYAMAKAILLAGKHALIEMPMASSAAQCQELIELARARGLVLMVGHTYLYSEPVRKLREIVDNEDIGKIRYIAAQRLTAGVRREGVNVAWDLAAHDISIILHLVQELPHNVVCRGAADVAPGAGGATSISLNFANNRQAIVRSNWHDSRNVTDMTIIGSKRMLVYDDISVREKIKIFGAGAAPAPNAGAPRESLFSYGCGEVQLPDIRRDEPLKTECQHFLNCIRTGAVPLTGGVEGLEVVQILEASCESHRLGGAPVLLGRDAATARPAAPTPEVLGAPFPSPVVA